MNEAILSTYADGKQALVVNCKNRTHNIEDFELTMTDGTLDGTEPLEISITFTATVIARELR